MTEQQLTNNFFNNFVQNTCPKDQQPILQLLETRIVNTNGAPGRSIRLRLSDGVFSFSCCLGNTKIANRFEEEKITETRAIIQITDYTRTVVPQTKKTIMNVTDYKLIENCDTVFGTPVPHTGNPDEFRGIENFPNALQSTSSVAPNSPARKRAFCGGDASTPSKRTNYMPGGGVFEEPLMDIDLITPYVQKFKICGCVQSKEDPRTITTKKGTQMSVFSFVIANEKGAAIRVTAFAEQCDKYAEMIEVNKPYYILCSGGRAVSETNKRFDSSGHNYSITINRDSEIIPCTDREIEAPKVNLDVVRLCDIKNRVDFRIDVLAVIDSIGEVVELTTKANKQVKKRELTLVDDSSVSATLTLWDDQVYKFDDTSQGTVLGVKSVSVREFNGGFSLSTGHGSLFELEPDHEYSRILKDWYANNRDTAEIASVSAGAAGGSFERDYRLIDNISNLVMINDRDNEKGNYFTVYAMINSVRSENLWYESCPNEANRCRKKVTVVDGGGYNCDRCGFTSTCSYRYNLSLEISDYSANTWVSLFDDAAVPMIGKTAAEIQALKSEDESEFDNLIDTIRFNTYEFRVRVKREHFNDQETIRWTCVSARPPNYIRYVDFMKKSLAKLNG